MTEHDCYACRVGGDAGRAMSHGPDCRRHTDDADPLAALILTHLKTPKLPGGSWTLNPYETADDVREYLAATGWMNPEQVAELRQFCDEIAIEGLPGTANAFRRRLPKEPQ